MKILKSLPPNYDELKKAFNFNPKTTIFAYAPDIHNPNNRPIDSPLMAHEAHHIYQQGETPAVWWKRYIKDSSFRAAQEIPAYQVQYQMAKKIIKDRNRLHRYLTQLSIDLSGPMYGSPMSFQEAMEAIKREKLFDFDTRIVLKEKK